MPAYRARLDTLRFFQRLDLANVKVRAAAMAAMNENKNDLLKEAKLLVAKDEGTLERSGVAGATTFRNGVLEAPISFNTPYANRVHEEMLPSLQGDHIMHPGPTTQAKPPTEFGAPGGLYLTRPLLGKALRYSQHIARKIRAML